MFIKVLKLCQEPNIFLTVEVIEGSNDGDANERVLCVLKHTVNIKRENMKISLRANDGESEGLPGQHFTTFYAWR